MPDSDFAPSVRNVTDTMLGRRVLDHHHLNGWPGNLFRFALFRRAHDNKRNARKSSARYPTRFV